VTKIALQNLITLWHGDKRPVGEIRCVACNFITFYSKTFLG